MTRINVVPPMELCNQHLLAEWRELPRMKSYANKTTCKSIPQKYTLGTGHMAFFLDKGAFLEERYLELTKELLSRGFKLNYLEPFKMSDRFGWHDYTPTDEAMNINKERIFLRMPKTPRWVLSHE